jgi:hypothetical protein
MLADPRPLTPTHHALFYTLSTILTYVKDRLAAGVEATFQKKDPSAPWLRRSTALAGTRELTTTLCDVMCWVSRDTSLLTPAY